MPAHRRGGSAAAAPATSPRASAAWCPDAMPGPQNTGGGRVTSHRQVTPEERRREKGPALPSLIARPRCEGGGGTLQPAADRGRGEQVAVEPASVRARHPVAAAQEANQRAIGAHHGRSREGAQIEARVCRVQVNDGHDVVCALDDGRVGGGHGAVGRRGRAEQPRALARPRTFRR